MMLVLAVQAVALLAAAPLGGGAAAMHGRSPRARAAMVEMQGAGGKGFGAPPKRSARRGASEAPAAPAVAATRRMSKGVLSPMRTVPAHIPRPDYADTGSPGYRRPVIPWDIEVKGPEAIAGMRAAGRLAREVLDAAGKAIVPGVRLDEIDRIVHDEVRLAAAARAAPCRARAPTPFAPLPRADDRARRLPFHAQLPRLPKVGLHLSQR